MRKRSLLDEQSDSLALDISPLLDVVFILLIFFIVTSVFINESGVEVKRPQAMSAQQLSKQSILIAINHNNEVWYGGAQIGIAGVKPLVHELLKTKNLPIIIQADEASATKTLIQVLDHVKLTGAENVHVATLKETS